VNQVVDFILSPATSQNNRKELLLAEKAYKIIQQKRMESVDKNKLMQAISLSAADPKFNLYAFVEHYF
jgi:LAO/AO transport system kinase